MTARLDAGVTVLVHTFEGDAVQDNCLSPHARGVIFGNPYIRSREFLIVFALPRAFVDEADILLKSPGSFWVLPGAEGWLRILHGLP